jgi:prepilin-type N-terminal cleavage/methylation domain-containing protein
MATTSRNRAGRHLSHHGGFTFAELLATVVLIGIIMPVAMQTIALCTRLGGLSRKETEAASLARAKLTELIASKDWQSGSKQGDFGSDWPGYHWTNDVGTWTDSIVNEITLTVHWQSQGRDREITLASLVYAEDE